MCPMVAQASSVRKAQGERLTCLCNSDETDLLATDEADAALLDATLNDELNAKLACAATDCALLLACTDALDKLADARDAADSADTLATLAAEVALA